MTREEQIEQAAMDYAERNAIERCGDLYPSRHRMMSAKNFDAYDIEQAYDDGAQWADKTMIDKACDLYRKELRQMQNLIAMIRKGAAEILDIEGSVADFRKAMEE